MDASIPEAGNIYTLVNWRGDEVASIWRSQGTWYRWRWHRNFDVISETTGTPLLRNGDTNNLRDMQQQIERQYLAQLR